VPTEEERPTAAKPVVWRAGVGVIASRRKRSSGWAAASLLLPAEATLGRALVESAEIRAKRSLGRRCPRPAGRAAPALSLAPEAILGFCPAPEASRARARVCWPLLRANADVLGRRSRRGHRPRGVHELTRTRKAIARAGPPAVQRGRRASAHRGRRRRLRVTGRGSRLAHTSTSSPSAQRRPAPLRRLPRAVAGQREQRPSLGQRERRAEPCDRHDGARPAAVLVGPEAASGARAPRSSDSFQRATPSIPSGTGRPRKPSTVG